MIYLEIRKKERKRERDIRMTRRENYVEIKGRIWEAHYESMKDWGIPPHLINQIKP